MTSMSSRRGRRVNRSRNTRNSSSEFKQQDPFFIERKEMFTVKPQRFRNRKELKYLDLASSQSYVFDTTGFIAHLNLVAEGDDNTTRAGRQICVESIEVTGKANPVNGSTAATFCRLMLVYDSQTNGATPAITDVLAASTSASFYNLDNRERFHVLVDHRFAIGAFNTTSTQTYAQSPTVEVIDIHRKVKLCTTFKGTTGAIGSISTGSIFLLSIGDSPVNGGALADLATRIRFTDLSS